MIIPFNESSTWYEAKDISGWRVLTHVGTHSFLYDSAVYTEEVAKEIATHLNKERRQKNEPV